MVLLVKRLVKIEIVMGEERAKRLIFRIDDVVLLR